MASLVHAHHLRGDFHLRFLGDVLFHLEASQIGWTQGGHLSRIHNSRDHLDIGSIFDCYCHGHSRHEIGGGNERHHRRRFDDQGHRYAVEVGL